MDDLNLSDAILIALANAGWTGRLVPKGTETMTFRKKRQQVHTIKVMPAGLVVPRGLTWHKQAGRFYARLWVGGKKDMVHVGTCAPVQGELDALGERWAALDVLRKAGATLEELKGRASWMTGQKSPS